MPRKVMPATESETWNMPPGAEEGWASSSSVGSPHSSQATAAHLKQTKKSWVLDTPPRTIDAWKKSKRKSKKKDQANADNRTFSRQALFGRNTSISGTPATEASTPEQQGNKSSQELPETYVEMVANAFGSKADLYQDVLGCSRSATPRAVRIAYFKRGREVLSERQEQHGSSQPTSATISGHISDIARLRFQAVSMAYEIISNPTWFDAYERCRLITEDDDDDDDDDDDEDSDDFDETEIRNVLSDPELCSTQSLASMSALRRSSSHGSLRSRRTHTGVRWNEEVEELVFNLDPEEHKNRKKDKKKKRKSKKKKKRIAVETDVDLETHLEQLDKEAEQHFVHDFLDDLEQSIEQMLSTSFGGDNDEMMSEDESDDEDEEEEEVAAIPKQLFPDEVENELVREDLKTPKQPIKQRRVPNTPKKKKKKKKVPRKLDTSDIEDDEFETYKNHRRRRIPKSKNSFVDKESFHHGQEEEAMDGSEPFDAVQCNPSAENDEGDDGGDSYVSFSKVKDPSLAIQTSLSYDAAPYSPKTSDAASTRSAPVQSPSKRGKSAWHPSPHSPKRATMDSSHSFASPTDRKVSMQNDLIFASPDGEQAQVMVAEQAPFTPPLPKSPKRSPTRSTRARSKSKAKKHFEAPTDISVSKKYEMRSFEDGDSAAYSIDDTISTLSASVVQRNMNRDFTNSRYKEGLEQDKAEQERLKRVKEEEGTGPNTSTTNMDRLNTSMEAVLQGTGNNGTAPSTPANRSNTEFVEISPTSEVDVTSLFCFGLCGDEERAETARAAALAQGSPDDPSFTAFLMVYLSAMATDLARLGHSIQKNITSFDFLHSMEIDDKDLDGMLTILESEMEEVPGDIAKTLSREFLPSASSFADETAATGAYSSRSI